MDPAVSKTEIAHIMALQSVPGLGNAGIAKLIERLGSAEAVWAASLSAINPLVRQAITPQAWEDSHHRIEPIALYDQYHHLQIQVLHRRNPGYPPLLAETQDAPLLLYLRGNPQALTARTLAMVGTRRISDYGRKVTQLLVEQLAPYGVCIVSGLAFGIDAQAHQSALDHRLPTVAVLGTGIDQIFPASNKRLAQQILEQGNAIVSEYPMGFPGNAYTFPQRNRIIAGLSYGTLVIEGPQSSGALITARCALEENRVVLAVPGNIFNPGSQGPLRLIRDGAFPVQNAQEILDALQWTPAFQTESRSTGHPPGDVQALPPREQALLQLIGYDPISVESLQQQSGLDAPNVSELLTLLELNDWVVSLPGGKICRK